MAFISYFEKANEKIIIITFANLLLLRRRKSLQIGNLTLSDSVHTSNIRQTEDTLFDHLGRNIEKVAMNLREQRKFTRGVRGRKKKIVKLYFNLKFY